MKPQFFFLPLLFLLCCSQQGFAQKLTPKIDSLIAGITRLTYSNKFDAAEALVLKYLEQPHLSPIEVFYGHFIFADVVKSSGNSLKATDLLLKSINYLQNVPDKKKFESLVYGNIGECFFNVQDYPNSKKYALQSIEASPSSSFRGSGHAVNNLIIGYSEYKEKKYPAALTYYDSAIREYLINGEACELPLCYMKIATVQQEQGQISLAKTTLNKAIFLSDSCNIDQYRLLTKIALMDICKANKQYKEALDLVVEINQINERLYSESKTQLLRDLEVKYETELTRKENENLKKDVSIREPSNLFQRTVLVVLLVFVSIILLLVTYILKLRDRKNTELSNQLRLIETQNEERKTLLKEVHHRVKNNLQVITSLLSLQTPQIKDEHTIQLFQQSQYRINAMAMVHEMLYQSDDLAKIQIKPYFQELVNSLVFSIKGAKNNIKVNLDIPPIYLGLDTAIPLGLLINEVITNALTHGIKGDTPGEIYIQLEPKETPHFLLKIGDNGIGCPDSITFKNTPSLGLKLMYQLSRQLLGKIEKDGTKEGCHYCVEFRAV